MKRPHLKLKAVQASSQDYNQSIFCTLNRFGAMHNFWSSQGSLSPDTNEYLTYQIAGELSQGAPEVAFDLGRTAQIFSFTLAVFDPSTIQGVGHDYPPRQA